MKIWGEGPKVPEVYGKNKNISKAEKTSGTTSKQDEVSISNEAKNFQTITKAVKEAPDVREDRIRELRDRYESGNYKVEGKDVAAKILESMINKKN
mgnify:CR=1 FL=1|jgi:negative regulator of flagellin synthesis FlgM